MNSKVSERSFTFWFYRAVAIIGFVPFVIFTLDVLLTLTVPHPLYGGLLLRPAQALFFAPLTVALGFLCARRQPDNSILLCWSYSDTR
jgi:hypothetical protein